MKMDNKGFSVIELLITTVLFSTVALAVTFFITTGMNTCNVAQNYINLQMESQIIINQLSNFTIEGNDVSFSGDGTNNGTYHIYFVDKNTKDTKREAIICFVAKQKKLFYYELDPTLAPPIADIKEEISKAEDITQDVVITYGELLGENVSFFEIKTDKKPYIEMNLTLEYDDNKYQTQESVTLRNKVVDKTNSLID